MKRFFSVFLTATYLFTTLLAQAPEEITLLGVEVEGNRLTSDTMIRYTAGLRPGETINTGDFSRAVKRLWQLGLFKNIQIRLDKESSDGVFITISVEENPILGSVKYKGNKKLKDKKFEEEVDLRTGQRITPGLIKKVEDEIKALYADEGYLLAEVEGELIPPKGDTTALTPKEALTRDLVFRIKENKKVKLKHIDFEGNQAFSDYRLRRVLKETKQQRWYLFWRSYFERDKYQEDKDKLATFYRNHGYRDFAILKDTTFYSPNKRSMSIRITVEEGPRYRYRNFSWEGNTLFDISTLERVLNLKSGDYYNEEEFNVALYNNVQGLYMDRGYIYSQIEPNFIPVGEDSLDIHFVITENHQVYVRNIYIHGNTKTRENVIRRELRIFPGDVFNRDHLIRSQRDLFILNYFSNVVPDVTPVDEDEVDLEITVEEKSSDRANANIGFSGVYGMTGGGGVEFNNFRGLGQQLLLSFNVGSRYTLYANQPTSKYRSFNFSFVDPMIFDTRNRVGFSAFYIFQGQATSYYFPLDLTTRGGSVQWGRRFKWPDDFFRGYWVFRMVKKNYQGSQEDLERYVKGLTVTKGINITQVLSRDSRDRPEFTTQGSRFVWEATYSGGFLGGNEDFYKHVLNLEWYTPTFWKFVLMSSLKMGVIEPIPAEKGERSIIPFDEKFVMGGNGIPYGNMLRGYSDNSIGPVIRGNPVGGNALFRAVVEFRVPFSENPVIYGLAFAEGGNVWNTTSMTEPFNIARRGPLSLKRAAGVGIRFFMPMIGMLGFDMGYGFDDVSGNGKPEGWNYTILFGQQF
jgi:outer membrane protein insertion porin family